MDAEDGAVMADRLWAPLLGVRDGVVGVIQDVPPKREGRSALGSACAYTVEWGRCLLLRDEQMVADVLPRGCPCHVHAHPHSRQHTQHKQMQIPPRAPPQAQASCHCTDPTWSLAWLGYRVTAVGLGQPAPMVSRGPTVGPLEASSGCGVPPSGTARRGAGGRRVPIPCAYRGPACKGGRGTLPPTSRGGCRGGPTGGRGGGRAAGSAGGVTTPVRAAPGWRLRPCGDRAG